MTTAAAPPSGDTTMVCPRGELCADTIGAFRRELLTAAADGAGDLVVDLHSVTIFSAAAMRVVVSAQAQVRERGADLWLVNPSPLTARALEAVGLDTLVTR